MNKSIWFIFFTIFAISSCSSINDSNSESQYEWHENALRFDLNSENVFPFLEIRERCDDSLGTNCEVFNITSNYSIPEFRFEFNNNNILAIDYFIMDFLPDSIVNLPGFSSGDTIEILNLDYGPEASGEYTNSEEPNIYYRRYFVDHEFNTGTLNTLRKLEFRIISNRKIVFYLKYVE